MHMRRCFLLLQMKAFCYEKLINIQVPPIIFGGPDGWGLSTYIYLKYISRLLNWNFWTTPQLPTWPLFLESVPLLHVGLCRPHFSTFPLAAFKNFGKSLSSNLKWLPRHTRRSLGRARSTCLTFPQFFCCGETPERLRPTSSLGLCVGKSPGARLVLRLFFFFFEI